MAGSKGWWKALHYSSVMVYNFLLMLALYPSLLVSFVLLLLLYSFLISGIKLSIPKLQREEVQTQSLFAKFESLYPKEEKKEEEKVPTINLLATAVGSVRLALAKVDGQTKALRIGSQVGSYKVTAIERNYITLSKLSLIHI